MYDKYKIKSEFKIIICKIASDILKQEGILK